MWAAVSEWTFDEAKVWVNPWLFSIYIDGAFKKAYERKQGSGVKIIDRNERVRLFNQLLFTDYTALALESAEQHQCLVTEVGWLCELMKLKVNLEKKQGNGVWRKKTALQMEVEMEAKITEVMSSSKYFRSSSNNDGWRPEDVKWEWKRDWKPLV